MKKIYGGNRPYITLCYDIGQKVIKHYWADCVVSMAEILEEKQKGEKFIVVVFRRYGAEVFPRNKGISARFSYYKQEETESSLFLLDYETKSVYSISWEEAEEILAK